MDLIQNVYACLSKISETDDLERKASLLERIAKDVCGDKRIEGLTNAEYFQKLREKSIFREHSNTLQVKEVIIAIERVATQLYGLGDQQRANEIYNYAATLEDECFFTGGELDTLFEDMGWTPEKISLSRKYGINLINCEKVAPERYIGIAKKMTRGCFSREKSYVVLLSDDKVLSGNNHESWNRITLLEDGNFKAERTSYEGHANLNRTIREENILDNEGRKISGIRYIRDEIRESFPPGWQTEKRTEVYKKGSFGWVKN